MIYVTVITLLLYAAIVFIGACCDIKENSLVDHKNINMVYNYFIRKTK